MMVCMMVPFSSVGKPPGTPGRLGLVRFLRGPSGQAARAVVSLQPLGDALAHGGATHGLTGLRNRSAGLRVALMLLDVRHGLNLRAKMHALCQPANKFSR